MKFEMNVHGMKLKSVGISSKDGAIVIGNRIHRTVYPGSLKANYRMFAITPIPSA
ncbi:hypothetical protein KSF78_0009748 [Schistosoma japonicum]|nr:hypothetical protein KSF78_0009748 [Schistosoma japonicum]KAH8848772.1 hypothetical protein KSF78_0009748 [Schistosoma japonicum]